MEPTTEEIAEFLESLRASGEVNMFGAGIHLEREFGFTRQEAAAALKKWMGSK